METTPYYVKVKILIADSNEVAEIFTVHFPNMALK